MKYLWAGALALLLLGRAACQSAQGQGIPAAPADDPAAWRAAQGAALLTQIRLADPDYRVILMAYLKEQELNLLLNREVKPTEIALVAKGLLSQFNRRFPGRDLSVVVFRPIVPLREAGIARINGRTGEISYTPGTP